MKPAVALLLALSAFATSRADQIAAPPPPAPAAPAQPTGIALSDEARSFCARFAVCTDADFARWSKQPVGQLPGDSVAFEMTTAADGKILSIDAPAGERRGVFLKGMRRTLVGRMKVDTQFAGGIVRGVLRPDGQGRLVDFAFRAIDRSAVQQPSAAVAATSPAAAPSPGPAPAQASAPVAVHKDNAAASPASTPTSAVKPAPASAEEEGKRSPESILHVIRQHIGGFRYSYNKALRDNPGMGGKISLKFTISPPGDIVAISVVESNTGNAGLDQEILDKARRMKFDAIEKGDVTITYAFVLDKQ